MFVRLVNYLCFSSLLWPSELLTRNILVKTEIERFCQEIRDPDQHLPLKGLLKKKKKRHPLKRRTKDEEGEFISFFDAFVYGF